MQSRLVPLILLGYATIAHADFSYQQTVRLTGGALMQFAAMAGGKLTEPILITASVKGKKLAYVNAHTGSLVDLEARTITTINFDRKQYWVQTFDELKQMMESAGPSGSTVRDIQVTSADGPKVNNLLGQDTKQKIVNVTMTLADPRSGNNVDTQIHNEMDMATSIPAAEELHAFYKRMSGTGWAPGGMPGMNRPEMMKAVTEVYKNVNALEGLPLRTVTTVSGSLPGLPNLSPGAPAPLGAGKVGAIAAIMARRQQQATPAGGGTAGSTSGSSALLEVTTEVTSYSDKPVDASVFQVPSGFSKTAAPTVDVPQR